MRLTSIINNKIIIKNKISIEIPIHFLAVNMENPNLNRDPRSRAPVGPNPLIQENVNKSEEEKILVSSIDDLSSSKNLLEKNVANLKLLLGSLDLTYKSQTLESQNLQNQASLLTSKLESLNDSLKSSQLNTLKLENDLKSKQINSKSYEQLLRRIEDDPDDIKITRQNLVEINNLMNLERLKSEETLEGLTKEYEEKIKHKRNEAKLARFLSKLRVRNIAVNARAGSLMRQQKLQADMNSIAEYEDKYRKFVRESSEKYMKAQIKAREKIVVNREEGLGKKGYVNVILICIIGYLVGIILQGLMNKQAVVQ